MLNYLESTGTNRRLSMNPPYAATFSRHDSRTIGQKITDGFPHSAPRWQQRRPSKQHRVTDVLKPSIIQQWNLTLEHQFANNRLSPPAMSARMPVTW